MDRKKMAVLVQERHGFKASPDDPAFVVATLAEAVMAEARAELQKMLTETLDQMSAAALQAETAARVKGEQLITQAGGWAAQRIQEAGEQAAAGIQAKVAKAEADTEAVTQKVKWAMTTAVVCSIAALAASASTIAAILNG